MDGRTGNGVYTFVLRPGADYEHKLFKLKIGESLCNTYTITGARVGVRRGRCAQVHVGGGGGVGCLQAYLQLMDHDVM